MLKQSLYTRDYEILLRILYKEYDVHIYSRSMLQKDGMSIIRYRIISIEMHAAISNYLS